jgi:hypothetical protein
VVLGMLERSPSCLRVAGVASRPGAYTTSAMNTCTVAIGSLLSRIECHRYLHTVSLEPVAQRVVDVGPLPQLSGVVRRWTAVSRFGGRSWALRVVNAKNIG